MRNTHYRRNVREVQERALYSIILHRRLLKPPLPIRIYCPGCGLVFLRRVNADRIEVHNSPVMQVVELTARDAWCELQHGCGTLIQLYWKD